MIFTIFLYKSTTYEIFSFHPQGATRFLVRALIFKKNYSLYGLELTGSGLSFSLLKKIDTRRGDDIQKRRVNPKGGQTCRARTPRPQTQEIRCRNPGAYRSVKA